MRRRAVKHGHWGLVALCLGIAFLPLGLRARIRARLLTAHVRLQALLGRGHRRPARPTSQDDEVLLLRAQVLELRRALLQANTARQVVAQDPRARLIPAEVLPLAGAADLVQRVALARGAVDGVRRGQPVLAAGVLAGSVARVTPSTCEVRLVTDPTFSIRATVPQGGQNVEGMLRGDGSGLLVFQPALLDPAAPPPTLHVGETVLCSRASVLCGVPALLGVVVAIERRPGQPLPDARVQPARDPSSLRHVVIVQPKKGAPS